MRFRLVLAAMCVASITTLGSCGSTDPADISAVSSADTPTTLDQYGRADADPHDGIAGEIVLTPTQITYRDQLGLTDLEAHDAFGYSCSLVGLPERFERFANQPKEELTP